MAKGHFKMMNKTFGVLLFMCSISVNKTDACPQTQLFVL